MNRRDFLKGLLAAAALTTAQREKLGELLKESPPSPTENVAAGVATKDYVTSAASGLNFIEPEETLNDLKKIKGKWHRDWVEDENGSEVREVQDQPLWEPDPEGPDKRPIPGTGEYEYDGPMFFGGGEVHCIKEPEYDRGRWIEQTRTIRGYWEDRFEPVNDGWACYVEELDTLFVYVHGLGWVQMELPGSGSRGLS